MAEHKTVSIPLICRGRWSLWAGAVIAPGMSLFLLAIWMLAAVQEPGPSMVALLLYCLCFCGLLMAMGRVQWKWVRSWVDFTPSHIHLRIGSRVVQSLPVEDIRLVYAMEQNRDLRAYYGIHSFCNIILSTADKAQLAHRRELQLQKGPVTRGELPFRKRAAGWEETFLREYLKKQERRFLRKRDPDILFLTDDYSGWIRSLLETLYPRLTVEDQVKRLVPVWPGESDADRFRRIPGGMDGPAGMILLALLFSPLAVLMGCVGGWEAATVICLLFLPLLILGGICSAWEAEVLEPLPEGIRYWRKKKPAGIFPVEKIATLAVVAVPVKQGEAVRVVVAPQTVEALAAQALSRAKPGTPLWAEFQARQLLPDGEKQLAHWELRRRMSCIPRERRSRVVAAYTRQRMEKLMTTYPHAQVLWPGTWEEN